MAGEKNSKYKPEYDELEFSRPMTVHEVKSIGKSRKGISCLYGFFENDKPVYFGKTINSKRRFEVYCSSSSHNELLNEFIKSNIDKAIVKIIEYNGNDLLDLESYMINKHYDSLFNISKNKAPKWACANVKPWVAGSGVRCPTSYILSSIKDKNVKDKIKRYLKKIGEKERCIIEVERAMFSEITEARYSKWLDIVTPKIINCLES